MRHSTSGDKTYSLAQVLIAEKLNRQCRNSNSSCIFQAEIDADNWLCMHPVGSGVSSSSAAWQQIKPTYNLLNKYNNGNLDCAPRCPNSLINEPIAPNLSNRTPTGLTRIGAPAER